MKVSKAQAQANRAHVVETASHLFRERGFDGVGVADLMAAAGFTHGGFYKQFGSKTDLIAEATACGIERTLALAGSADPMEFVHHYVSRAHRDNRADGCTMAALGGDAARQPEVVRSAFVDGIESLVAGLSQHDRFSGLDAAQARAKVLEVLTHAVGAIVMSRACPDDSPLADEILSVCRAAISSALPASKPATQARRRPRAR